MEAYAEKPKEVLDHLDSSENGLSEEEAKNRLESEGKNEIKRKEEVHPSKIFFDQFKSFMIYILLIAAVISAVLPIYKEGFAHLTLIDFGDAIAIGIILILNAILGFVQEYKAEKAIEALKKMASLKAVAVRDGKERKIDAKELVPGDIIMLETGEKVPADARLLEISNLQTQEAALTGKSTPVKKKQGVLDEDTGVADRKNMIFSGTVTTAGRAKAVITSTGMKTEIGKIAKMIQESKKEHTPLQKKLKVLGERLGLAALIVCVIVFLTGVLLKYGVIYMLLVSISLAVAAIPEGLPAVVTISLALGVQRMVDRNALVRRLPSVETLGSTTVICTDKTGTLTLDQMTVRKIFANNETITVSGRGYEKEGNFYVDKDKADTNKIEMLLKIGCLCNDAKLREGDIIGDPTEGSLLVSAAKAGMDYEKLRDKYPRNDENQFTSKRKRMSTLHNMDGKNMLLCKGAPDVILDLCNRILIDGEVKRLTRARKKKILEMNEHFAEKALRVLGFAYKETDKPEEEEMVFVGLQAMIDPPRKEAKEAIEKCRAAGIKVVMVTGDLKTTAEAIGRELGLKGKAIDGKELEDIYDLEKHVEDISIYARVNPEHKSKILQALRDRGHIVSMTGDGVNDAPALKKADIGISMGITGTDVAKEASDMILTDDNFASIVNAVEEGRGIYDNIQKFVEYLLSSNLGEVLTLFVALMAGMPLPLIPLQILWINLITDGLPALSLGVEPNEPGIMKRKPKDPKAKIITRERVIRMGIIGFIMMAGTLGIFYIYLSNGGWSFGSEINIDNPPGYYIKAITMAFSTLMMFQMFNVINRRSDNISIFKLGFFRNKKLLLAVGLSIVLQFVAVYTPLSAILRTTGLGAAEWGYVLLTASSVFVFEEAYKLIKNRNKNKKEEIDRKKSEEIKKKRGD
ncbi:calcium-translocating P-type ATPase, SERCA-type [Candidatus Woesearchaeota archaeon]|nr:calcium-translocating P-type ATPase, SERCA-type [Candidatus Woesearchaeota archaeon]